MFLPRFGGPDVLELRDDASVPDLKPNEVLVRARAVSVNPLDTRVSSSVSLFKINYCFLSFFQILIITVFSEKLESDCEELIQLAETSSVRR